MADFNSLYKEEGLRGIIPYAFGLAGAGYQFLCEKLKEGVPFWVMVSTLTKIPFYEYDFDEERLYFKLYTDEKLAKAGPYMEAVLLDEPQLAMEIWKRYRDLGISHLKLDDYVWVSITDLVAPASYDGFLSNNAPLRNAALNAELYYTMQYYFADYSCDELLGRLWRTLKESQFYVLVKPIKKLRPGQALTKDNMDVHRLNLDDGKVGFAVFTDWQFVVGYAASLGLPAEEYSAAYTPGLQDLLDYMWENPENPAVFNYLYGSFEFDLDAFAMLEEKAAEK